MKKTRVLQILLLSGLQSETVAIKNILDNSRLKCSLHLADDESRFRMLLEKNSFDVILVDYDLPALSASAALKLTLALHHDVPCIVLSGLIGERNAVELIQQGAVDVVIKDRINSLPFSVVRALKEAKMIKQLQRAKNQLRDKKIIKAQNEELKKNNEAKDKFFSIIAHDLRTPLNSLLGFSELLVANVAVKKFDECEKIGEIIHHSSLLATNLLSNLLAWAQTQIGSIEFNPGLFVFSDLVHQVINQFVDAALLKNITIFNEVPENVPVFADRDMLATILRNLISNAVKFTHPGGNIRIACEQTGHELTVVVHDTGVGIPQNKIKDLFQIGSTSTTSGTSKESGSGLGLILCKEFVTWHKGKIWVESNSNGTSFYFSLPVEG